MATRLWRRGRLGAWGGLTGRGHRRGASTGAVRCAWPLLWRSHPRGVDVASRRTFEDPIEVRLHPLGVVAVALAVSAVVFAWGFFLRIPPLPGLSSTRLQCLAVVVLLLFSLLFRVLGGLLLLRGLAPLVAIDLILLYWRPRGTDINQSLPLTCSGLKSLAMAALTRAATSSSAGASLDIRHASRSRDETPGPISSILSGRDINGRILR